MSPQPQKLGDPPVPPPPAGFKIDENTPPPGFKIDKQKTGSMENASVTQPGAIQQKEKGQIFNVNDNPPPTMPGSSREQLQKDVQALSSGGKLESGPKDTPDTMQQRAQAAYRAMTPEQLKGGVQKETKANTKGAEQELGAFGGALGGIPGAIAGGVVGGALGSKAEKDAGLKPDKYEAIEGGALQGLYEAGGKLVAGAAGKLAGMFAEKVTARAASKMVADELATTPLSREQFGSALQETFDAVRKAAGQGKGEIVEKFANNPVTFTNMQEAVHDAIVDVMSISRDSPSLLQKVEGKATLGNTMDVLKELNASLENPRTLKSADKLRQNLWALRNNMDPSTSASIISKLNKAITQDVAAGLPKDAAEQYLAFSNRYRQLSEMGEKDVLKKLFGDERVAPDKVVEIMMQAPETSIKAIRELNPASVKSAQRALFEEMFNTGNLKNIDPSVTRELFGANAKQVQELSELLARSEKGKAVERIPGKVGAAAELVINSVDGNPMAKIPAYRMAQVMGNPTARGVLIQALKSRPSQELTANLLRTLSGVVSFGGTHGQNESLTTAPRGGRGSTLGEPPAPPQ